VSRPSVVAPVLVGMAGTDPRRKSGDGNDGESAVGRVNSNGAWYNTKGR
jgi:hypothetical protein